MKKFSVRQLVLQVIFLLCVCTRLFSQNIGIGGTPDASAKVDIQSSNSGFLLPRLTQAQRDSITSPAAGLMIYNTTSNCLNFWTGSNWNILCNALCNSIGGTAAAGADSLECGDSTTI